MSAYLKPLTIDFKAFTVKESEITEDLMEGFKAEERILSAVPAVKSGDPKFQLGQALELKPGCIYALEADTHLSESNREWIRKYLGQITEETGVKFIVFDKGLKISRVKELEPEAEAGDRIERIFAEHKHEIQGNNR